MSIEDLAGSERLRSLRPQRLAEMVAGALRTRILSGDLEDGEILPKEEDLRREYPVSKPSLREAMRILEAEGLVTIRRGSLGGAVVHRPTTANVAYTLAMVLRTEQVGLRDVAQALRQLEPDCAALCAQRRDRRRTVLPVLRAAHQRSLQVIDDLVQATRASLDLHEALVTCCGNRSLIIVTRALQALWEAHESGWSEAAVAEELPVARRRAALQVHAELIELIEAGEPEAVRDLAARHVRQVQTYPPIDVDVDLSVVAARVRP